MWPGSVRAAHDDGLGFPKGRVGPHHAFDDADVYATLVLDAVSLGMGDQILVRPTRRVLGSRNAHPSLRSPTASPIHRRPPSGVRLRGRA